MISGHVALRVQPVEDMCPGKSHGGVCTEKGTPTPSAYLRGAHILLCSFGLKDKTLTQVVKEAAGSVAREEHGAAGEC